MCAKMVLGKKRTGKSAPETSAQEKSAQEKSARGIMRSRKKAQIQLFLTDQLLITVEFLSHINVNMKMCVI